MSEVPMWWYSVASDLPWPPHSTVVCPQKWYLLKSDLLSRMVSPQKYNSPRPVKVSKPCGSFSPGGPSKAEREKERERDRGIKREHARERKRKREKEGAREKQS